MRIKGALIFAVALTLVAVWIFYQFAAIASRGGDNTPLYSTERHDPYGTAAMKDLLIERGVPTSILLRPAPDEATGAVLIQVLTRSSHGFRNDPSLQQAQLREWIQRGNTVIQFTRAPTDLMMNSDLDGVGFDKTGERLSDIEEHEAAGKPPAEIPGDGQMADWIAIPDSTGKAVSCPPAVLANFAPLILSPQKFAPKTAALSGAATTPIVAPATSAAPTHWQPLAFMSGSHDWVAAVRSFGNGRIIVVGSQTPILNHALDTNADLEFVLSLIAPADKLSATPVIFDEWSHGLGHEGTVIGFIHQIGLLPAVFQLFFFVAMYVWATSGFTPPDSAFAKRSRSSTEQIDTLSYLYSQSMKLPTAFEKVHAEVRRRIASVLRCSPTAIEATLGHVAPEVAAKARAILAGLDEMGRGPGPVCPSCGYDLTRNASGKCPECGTEIHWSLKERIDQTDALADVPERVAKRPKKSELRLATALRESHQFCQEFARVRNRHI